jgi:hypothetical protein
VLVLDADLRGRPPKHRGEVLGEAWLVFHRGYRGSRAHDEDRDHSALQPPCGDGLSDFASDVDDLVFTVALDLEAPVTTFTAMPQDDGRDRAIF